MIDSGGDLYAGNVPYAMRGHPAADRLSFYYDSKCDISIPDVPEDRAVALDIRHEGCTALPEPTPAVALAGGALLVAALACRRYRVSRTLAGPVRRSHEPAQPPAHAAPRGADGLR